MKAKLATVLVPLLLAGASLGQPGNLVGSIDNPQPLPASYTKFGSQIVVAGNNLMVSAPGAGKIYVFNANTRSLVRTLNNPTGTFGDSMSGNGNLVAVGDYGDRTVSVFNYTTGQVVRTFSNSAVTDYGYTTAMVGNYLAVGCYSNPGIFVYSLTTGNLVSTCRNPTTDNAYFGRSISECGAGRLLVGHAGYDSPGVTNSGAAYLYDMATGALLRTFLPDTTAPAPQWAYKEFGISVGHIGDDPLISCWSTAYRFNDEDGALMWKNDQGARSVFAAMGDSVVVAHDTTAVQLSGTSGKSLLTVSTNLVDGDHFLWGIAAYGDDIFLGDMYARRYWSGTSGAWNNQVGKVYEFQMIPEPASLCLFALGGLALIRGRKKHPTRIHSDLRSGYGGEGKARQSRQVLP